MRFVGRSRELGALRAALDAPVASLVRVTGPRGVGKSSLVRRALRDFPHIEVAVPPLPEPLQRATLTRAIRTEDERPDAPGEAATWTELFTETRRIAAGHTRPFVLFLDDVHRLGEARARYLEPLRAGIERARAEGVVLHLVVAGARQEMPEDDELPDDAPPVIAIGPLPFRAAAELLPGSRATDLLRAYAVFGGIPRVLATLDRDVALGTNARRALLGPDAPLRDAGGIWVERDVVAPARYYAILRALSGGPVDWATVHAGVPDVTRGGQIAPYMQRLVELGLIEVTASLDARPRSRSKRYAIVDPFIAFWTRFVLPLGTEPGRAGGDAYSTVVRPELDDHLRRMFPIVCRQHLLSDSIETLGDSARQVGALWGAGYDIPVAGFLNRGAAFYGTCAWSARRPESSPLDELDTQVRETRYGFGREARLRLLFTATGAPGHLQREAARRHDAFIIDAAALAGTE